MNHHANVNLLHLQAEQDIFRAGFTLGVIAGTIVGILLASVVIIIATIIW